MFTLYKFELRKIIKRKIVWITGGILLMGLLLWGIASAFLPQSREYADNLSGYEMNRMEYEEAQKIAGREIDQSLIDEMRKNYEGTFFNSNYKKALPYLDVYEFIVNILVGIENKGVLTKDIDTIKS